MLPLGYFSIATLISTPITSHTSQITTLSKIVSILTIVLILIYCFYKFINHPIASMYLCKRIFIFIILGIGANIWGSVGMGVSLAIGEVAFAILRVTIEGWGRMDKKGESE